MKMKRKFFAVLLLAASLSFAAGCNDPYGACAKAGADIGAGIAQGMQTADALRQQGIITPAEESNVLGYLEFANTADKAFLICVSAAHAGGNKAGTFTACAQDFNTALNNPAQLTLIHVSNTAGSQTVSTIINGITTGVSAVITALGGA
jgi:hypothetical protein